MRTSLLAAVTVLLLCPLSAVTAQTAGDGIERRAGVGRVETAVAVALTDWPAGAPAVLLATAGDFPDALAAAPLAAALEAPLLLTPADALPEVVADAIERLAPEEVLVLGGPDAVSGSVVDAVRHSAGSARVERVAGRNRFETAAALALRAGAPERVAVLASGLGFADALAAGATAATPARPPLLLVTAERIPAATLNALDELAIERALVVGGPAAIDWPVTERLRERGLQVRRVAGRNRFGTAAALLRVLPRLGEVAQRDRVVVATGTDFPDALAAGPLAAQLGATLTLAAPAGPPTVLLDELRLRQTASAVLVGGRDALGSEAEAGVRAAFEDPPPVTSADGRTLTVDGQAVAVRNERWRTASISDRGNPPTFTLLGTASGEVVDIVVTDHDVRDADDGEPAIGPAWGAASDTGSTPELMMNAAPLPLDSDSDEWRSNATASLRLTGCPCAVSVSASFGFSSAFDSSDVEGSFTVQAVRSDVPRHPLVDLPHSRRVTLTTPGQQGGFDMLLRSDDVVTLGHREGSGMTGHFRPEQEPAVSLLARATNLFAEQLRGAGMSWVDGVPEVVEEQAVIRLVEHTDRYRLALFGSDWMTGEAVVFASRTRSAQLPERTEPVTIAVGEPGQAAEVAVDLAAGEELALDVSWSLDRSGVACQLLRPGGQALESVACRGEGPVGAAELIISAESAGRHRLFVYSRDTGAGTYTISRR